MAPATSASTAHRAEVAWRGVLVVRALWAGGTLQPLLILLHQAALLMLTPDSYQSMTPDKRISQMEITLFN